jgi:hypothetical protein
MNDNQKIVIISSIIYLLDKPLSYTNTRSVYSAEERAEQTKKTIESVRNKIPDAKIILLESGSKKELPFKIQDLVDEYLYVGDQPSVRFACDSKFKGLGEIVTLLQLRKQIIFNTDYFKISGRYFLNDNFDIDDWQTGDFNFRFRNPHNFSTVFYKFRGGAFKFLAIAFYLTIPFCLLGRPIEKVIFRFIPSFKIRKIERIGVSGLVAVDGELFNE